MFLKIKNRILKNLSIFLSISTLISAYAPATVASKYSKSSPKVETRKRIPKTFNISLKQQIDRRKFWRMNICKMSNEAVQNQLRYEISRYINRAPDIFVIDKQLIEKSDPRALLINLSTLNYLFDKYNLFTKEFIDFKRHSTNKYFVLLSEFQKRSVQSTPIDLGGIFLNNLDNYPREKQRAEISVKSKFWSARNVCEAYESTIVHEFGHFMTLLYIIKKQNIDLSGINIIRDSTCNSIDTKRNIEEFLMGINQSWLRKKALPTPYDNELKKIINAHPTWLTEKEKEDLLKTLQMFKPNKQSEFMSVIRIFSTILHSRAQSLEKTFQNNIKIQNESRVIKDKLIESLDNQNTLEYPMGEYGYFSSSEFIAEAFAHLECSDPENTSDLGKKMEQFIIKEMKFLQESKSVFKKTNKIY